MGKKIKSLLLLFIFTLSSCSLFADSQIPYLIEGEMLMEASSDYEIAGFDITFVNKGDKAISSFTFVFFIYDQDGNIPSIGRNNIVMTVDARLGQGQVLKSCLPLDDYLYEIPEEAYQIDYLYVSKIIYEDGSEWSDPMGVKAFS
ncbi:MAG: hypothetical protein K5866_06665 [Treponema sp.]|nr:hypothetical protein [Treponema sp.]